MNNQVEKLLLITTSKTMPCPGGPVSPYSSLALAQVFGSRERPGRGQISLTRCIAVFSGTGGAMGKLRLHAKSEHLHGAALHIQHPVAHG